MLASLLIHVQTRCNVLHHCGKNTLADAKHRQNISMKPAMIQEAGTPFCGNHMTSANQANALFRNKHGFWHLECAG
jgi:hypothetical protein